jgi:tripartite-type tricarboxylate transporter receptor subunit TctC
VNIGAGPFVRSDCVLVHQRSRLRVQYKTILEIPMKTRTFLKAMALPLAYQATSSLAQLASGRPIRVVVPLPAGSGNDFVARVITPRAGQLLGQTFVVDNKPGANGVIGAMEVVRAAPDGQTLLCATNSHLATNMAMIKNLPYDPRRDLTPIAGATVAAQLLVVKGNSPLRTLADFIAYAKSRPGRVAVGYSTSIVQLQFATLSKIAGIELLMVPYKGAPAAVNDVIGGVLDATLENPGLAVGQVSGGALRTLACMSKRNPLFPDTPAASETLAGFDFPLWNAFVGPAGMPREVVTRLGAAISQAQKQPEVANQFLAAGTPAFVIEPDELKAFIESEVVKYARLVKDAGIQPE